ncbi:hypothetical protein A3K48_01005 [candidate division WOR-1 bacterium RIFOXYA12_FULL_52_29]|uniref:Uncharacterized protein n=1 Tax=candidate division WOR-1 bacterium RIFOXYC12_FULL_54_18 TaxID=1802584 RepID=A0A1F4T4G2_UNCSA|nr:MAG: hypothetical protein A3K44_01005 [candidate division WOR-1 bacterium RIFOXYA2_FULL_51_19]OGC17171.1 MAG: hypothetical protein A3K48_01005 [candidate division WOR-1 bacterium RIFOXYA12_FULL_52_29]OGC26031.1 MAG: hypothetical protein A3K32_01000 [candidate division WOR-1 bacterium RIFOXYB2_FULL_45_9]OGC27588.1 MAG: hypothetical protein A3K49_01005 [candidate division WOR-1 bacterium RIFOXYC12_FULL_54_18]OGC29199.1 MAG: hypothetical protein A2346_00705 [candidate division WOR-1 bacterium R
MTDVKAKLVAKGLSLEALNTLGAQTPPLSGDALIEAALKAAGCTTDEIYGAQSQTVKDGHNTAMTALEAKATAYKALLERTTPPATPQELEQAKAAYDAALAAFQTAAKTGTTFDSNQLPDALKSRYNAATSGVATAVTTRESQAREATQARTRRIEQENWNAIHHIGQIKTKPMLASSTTQAQLNAISYNLPANQVILTVHTADQGDVLVLAEKQGNGYKIVTQSLANGQVVLNSQGQPAEIRIQRGSGLLEWIVRDTHFPVTLVTQPTTRAATGGANPANPATPTASATPPTGLNPQGRLIWQQLNDRGITVTSANVARINDGTVSREDAIALGLVGAQDQNRANVFTAYNKTDTDQVWDANELGHYLDVVKTVAEKSGRPIGQVLETFRNTRYLVTVNFDQIGTTIGGLGTTACANVNWADKNAAAAAVEQNLTGKVETNMLKAIKDRIAAGTITSQSQLEQYLFNAMMGSMTSDYAGWGVPELQGKVSAFKPRSTEQTGEDLTTWIKTGKSPEAGATGNGTDAVADALRKMQGASSPEEAKRIFKENPNLANNPQALEILTSHVSQMINNGQENAAIDLVSDLPKGVRERVYEGALQRKAKLIEDNKTANPETARQELNNLIALVDKIKAKEEQTPNVSDRASLTTIQNGLYQSILSFALASTNPTIAREYMDKIPPDAQITIDMQNHRDLAVVASELKGDQGATQITGLDARLLVLVKLRDEAGIKAIAENKVSGKTYTNYERAQAYRALALFYSKQPTSLDTANKRFTALYEARKLARAAKTDTNTDIQIKAGDLETGLHAQMEQLIQTLWGSEQHTAPNSASIPNSGNWRTDKTNMYKKFREGTATTTSTPGGGGGRTTRPVS